MSLGAHTDWSVRVAAADGYLLVFTGKGELTATYKQVVNY